MYIKQVIIEGFKSYKEQVATEPFSPKHNCVVGANGSGKTNFFHAIRFVLSDLFHNLRAEDRQALLHEGAGHQLLSAFVEIVFDNSDNRIPVDREEVRLRRTIGLKKDEYFLDKKHITKTEVMNLLESAGFSRSNPYYVVQQGKIASLTLMKDSERLDLLKEIGGTRVYEERRKESLKIMQETENKRKQIIEVVQYIEERLKELDEEKEELKKYQQLDKQRRSLEYTMFEKELQDARQKLEEIEEARTKVSEKSTSMYNSVLEAHERFKTLEKDLKNLTKEHQVMMKEKDSAEKRKTEAMKRHAKVELDVRDLEEKINGEGRMKEEVAKELKSLEKEIQKSRKELEKVRPFHDQQVIEEEEITKGIIDREKQLSILYQKQGRATQFSSKAARDKWLQKELDDLQRVLSSTTAQGEKLQEEIQQLNEELAQQETSIEARSAELQDQEALISKCHGDFSSLKIQRDELQETRKKLWKQENDLTTEIDKLKAEIVKAEKSLDHAAPGDIRRGLSSVRRICKDHSIPGVYGPICELLDCDEKFFTAVEVTAGNSLYHVVVETDEISTRIIRYLTAEKGGRVTFMPLNRVRAPEVTYPHSPDVVPLLKKLKFSSRFAPAFAQVFGRTVICRDLDVATKVARTDGLDCITLEGDQVSKKGGMTGGFYDYRRSKLKLMNIIRQNTKAVNSKQDELIKVRSSVQEIDQKITTIVSEQQKMDAKRGHHKSELEQLKQDIANATKQRLSISKALEKKKKLLANAHNQIDQLRAGMAMKRAEMGTDLIDQLTQEEKALLARLNPEITELKEKLILCKTNRVETETRKSELETNLSTNLVRRQQELEAMFLSADSESLSAELELKRQELKDAKASIDEATQQLKAIIDQIEKYTKQMRDMKNAKDELKALEDNYERTLQDEAKDLEQLLNKRNLLQAKREDYMKKIRDLGSLPSDAFEKYKRKSIKELHKMLHKCNEQLKKFSHVIRHCNRAFSSGRALGGHMRVHGNGTANGHSSCALNKSSKAEFSSDQIGDYSSTDISKLLLKKSDVPKSRSNDNHNWVQADSEEEDQQDDCKSNEENDTSMDVGQELSNGSAQKMLSLYTLRRNPKRNSRLMDREFSMELTARNNNSRVCTQCGKEFSSSKALFGHMRCHPDRDWRGIQPPSDNTNTDTDNNCAIVLAESSGLFPAYWQNSLESEDLESPVQKSGFVCEEKREQVEQASDNESDTESMKAAYQQPAYNFLNWSVTAKRGRRKPIKVTQTQDDHGDAEEEPEVNTKELEEDRDTAYFLVMLASSASNNNKNYDNGHGPVEIQLTEESVYDSKTQQAGKRESQGSIEDLEGGEEDQGWKGKSVKEIKKRKIGKAGRLAEGGETGNFSGEKQLDVGFAETAGKYKCSTCKKLFNSHQALGGHRASHRKVKGCFAMTNVNEEGQELAEEEITEEGTLLRIEYPSTANDLRSSPAREEERANLSHLTQEESLKPVTLSKKAKGHECSICHKVFPSGQALGGHKRCHWTGDRVTETASSVISTEKQPKGSSAQVRNVREQLFDLNEPAPVEEEDLEAAYGMVDVVPACADSVNKRVKMLEAVTNTGFRYVQCNICGHLFTSMECLRTHQMVHALMPSSSSPSQL